MHAVQVKMGPDRVHKAAEGPGLRVAHEEGCAVHGEVTVGCARAAEELAERPLAPGGEAGDELAHAHCRVVWADAVVPGELLEEKEGHAQCEVLREARAGLALVAGGSMGRRVGGNDVRIV